MIHQKLPGLLCDPPIEQQQRKETAMDDFISGFKRGARETVYGYWAPAVALWNLLSSTTDDLIRKANQAEK